MRLNVKSLKSPFFSHHERTCQRAPLWPSACGRNHRLGRNFHELGEKAYAAINTMTDLAARPPKAPASAAIFRPSNAARGLAAEIFMPPPAVPVSPFTPIWRIRQRLHGRSVTAAGEFKKAKRISTFTP